MSLCARRFARVVAYLWARKCWCEARRCCTRSTWCGGGHAHQPARRTSADDARAERRTRIAHGRPAGCLCAMRGSWRGGRAPRMRSRSVSALEGRRVPAPALPRRISPGCRHRRGPVCSRCVIDMAEMKSDEKAVLTPRMSRVAANAARSGCGSGSTSERSHCTTVCAATRRWSGRVTCVRQRGRTEG